MALSETNQGQAHALVVPYSAQGHLNPMLQLSKRLVSKGVRTTLAITVHLFRSMYMDPSGPSEVEIQTISDGYDHGGVAKAESIEAYQTSFEVVGSQTLRSLIRRLDESGKPVQAVIYDGFISWVLDVAKECGKLGVVFFTQTCAVNNVYYHVKKGLVELPLKDPTVSFPAMPRLEPSEMPSFVYALGSYPTYYDMLMEQFSNVEKADYVMVNIFYEMEKELVDWMSKNLWPVKTIGPAVPSAYLDKRLEDDKDYSINLFKPNNEACTRWLSRQRPRSVVYVSFGSMADLKPEQMAELAAALDRIRHRYSFLWIVRTSERFKLPPEFLAASAEEKEGESGLILTWCSQLEVLNHGSIGCFITHCGMNSTLEAISLGVPLVAVPQWSDQTTNAKFIEDVWRVGIRARPGKSGIIDKGEFEQCIEELMEGEKGKAIRESAKIWRDLAREAVDKGGSSDKNIDEFVAAMLSRRFRGPEEGSVPTTLYESVVSHLSFNHNCYAVLCVQNKSMNKNKWRKPTKKRGVFSFGPFFLVSCRRVMENDVWKNPNKVLFMNQEEMMLAKVHGGGKSFTVEEERGIFGEILELCSFEITGKECRSCHCLS
ncbi:hypothetical protein SAY87_004339 [Trapa incisa]|uniref:Glycosyltransferase n=1 Tax=Trapa incisa TaxID=236973 RepID=A0AAN7PKB1_9MYRT|nr:hypothetical protein SAY87_004339 [Trapa incisa]